MSPATIVSIGALVLAGASVPPAAPSSTTAVTGDTIVVGHRALRGATLPTEPDTTEVFADREGRRTKVSLGVRTIARQGANVVVTFIGEGRGGRSIDSVFFDASTMATRRHVEVQPKHRADLVYENGMFKGDVTDSTGTHHVELPVSADRLDFSVVSVAMLALSRTAGYEATIRAYDIALRKERDVTYRVIGPDRITWRGAMVDAVKTVVDFQTHQVTRWIAKSDGRELQREITMPTAHLNGATK